MPPNQPADRNPHDSSETLDERRTSPLRALPAALRAALSDSTKLIILAIACTTSIACLAGVWVLVVGGGSDEDGVTLEQVLDTLDSGAYIEAQDMAKKLREHGNLPAEELGGPLFALGAAACYEADDTWSDRKTGHYLAAARYLEEARDRGFPPGRRGEGLYLLGKSLYMSGQIPAARSALREALRANKRDRTDIRHLLAEAYMNDAKPDLERALKENTIYLSDERLPREQRNAGLLQRAQILLRLQRVEECTAALDQIPPKAKNRAEATILRARLLIGEARKLKNDREAGSDAQIAARQSYQEAVKTLRLAQGHDTLSTKATCKAMYLIGVCFQEIGDYRAALAQYTRTRKLFPDSHEGLACSLHEAELSRQFGRDAAALAGYRRVLEAIPDPENYSNPWVSLDDLRSTMLDAYEAYVSAENFDAALQMTKTFYPLFDRVRTAELTAQAYETWGDSLLAKSEHASIAEADELRHRGREQLRRAGRVYGKLAKMQAATRQYPEELWNSAKAYMKGQNYTLAVKMLNEYLKNEARRRHGEALAMLGEAKLSLGEIDSALEAFQECVEFHPRDVASYRARLLASMGYLEKGDSQQAENLLQENLAGEGMTPKSKEWRDSLFAMGELLYIERRYDEAVRRLEEAVARYPEDPRAIKARYLTADSYRLGAKINREKVKNDISGGTRAARSRESLTMFEKSLELFQEVCKALTEKNETGELDLFERSMLRNSAFAIGDVYFSLGRYQDAIKSYSTTTNRYQNKPEVLSAYVQIANAYRRLDRPAEARATLEQAKAVLNRMNKQADFATTTNYNREQWNDLLNWLTSL